MPPLTASSILTAAAGTTPPEESITVPLMYCDCAISGCVSSVSRKGERMAIAIFTPVKLLLGFISTSIKVVFAGAGIPGPFGILVARLCHRQAHKDFSVQNRLADLDGKE